MLDKEKYKTNASVSELVSIDSTESMYSTQCVLHTHTYDTTDLGNS